MTSDVITFVGSRDRCLARSPPCLIGANWSLQQTGCSRFTLWNICGASELSFHLIARCLPDPTNWNYFTDADLNQNSWTFRIGSSWLKELHSDNKFCHFQWCTIIEFQQWTSDYVYLKSNWSCPTTKLVKFNPGFLVWSQDTLAVITSATWDAWDATKTHNIVTNTKFITYSERERFSQTCLDRVGKAEPFNVKRSRRLHLADLPLCQEESTLRRRLPVKRCHKRRR